MPGKEKKGTSKKSLASKPTKRVESQASNAATDQQVEASGQPEAAANTAAAAEPASQPVGDTDNISDKLEGSTATMDTQETTAAASNGQINLTRSDKQRSTQMVVYTVDGRPGSVRFSKTLFKDKNAPEKVTLVTEAFAGPKEPKRQETKEERKARLAALPKPTAAEKVARMEAKLAKLRQKVASEQAPAGGASEQASA